MLKVYIEWLQSKWKACKSWRLTTSKGCNGKCYLKVKTDTQVKGPTLGEFKWGIWGRHKIRNIVYRGEARDKQGLDLIPLKSGFIR